MIAIGILTSITLFSISALHIYWALGGRWGIDVALPTRPHSQAVLFRPSPLMTLAIAVALALAASLVLLNFYWPATITKVGTWGLAGVFLLRGMGEFRYAGLFKTVKDTAFARYDTLYFTPLCLGLSLVIALIAYMV